MVMEMEMKKMAVEGGEENEVCAPAGAHFFCVNCQDDCPVTQQFVRLCDANHQHKHCVPCVARWVDIKLRDRPHREVPCIDPYCQELFCAHELRQQLGVHVEPPPADSPPLDPADLAEAADDLTQDYLRERVRLCPACAAPICKDGGCKHMKCTVCEHSFNWGHALRDVCPLEDMGALHERALRRTKKLCKKLMRRLPMPKGGFGAVAQQELEALVRNKTRKIKNEFYHVWTVQDDNVRSEMARALATGRPDPYPIEPPPRPRSAPQPNRDPRDDPPWDALQYRPDLADDCDARGGWDYHEALEWWYQAYHGMNEHYLYGYIYDDYGDMYADSYDTPTPEEAIADRCGAGWFHDWFDGGPYARGPWQMAVHAGYPSPYKQQQHRPSDRKLDRAFERERRYRARVVARIGGRKQPAGEAA